MKSKPSRSILELDDHDDTNYEALAMSSPRKSTKAGGDLDDFLQAALAQRIKGQSDEAA